MDSIFFPKLPWRRLDGSCLWGRTLGSLFAQILPVPPDTHNKRLLGTGSLARFSSAWQMPPKAHFPSHRGKLGIGSPFEWRRVARDLHPVVESTFHRDHKSDPQGGHTSLGLLFLLILSHTSAYFSAFPLSFCTPFHCASERGVCGEEGWEGEVVPGSPFNLPYFMLLRRALVSQF